MTKWLKIDTEMLLLRGFLDFYWYERLNEWKFIDTVCEAHPSKCCLKLHRWRSFKQDDCANVLYQGYWQVFCWECNFCCICQNSFDFHHIYTTVQLQFNSYSWRCILVKFLFLSYFYVLSKDDTNAILKRILRIALRNRPSDNTPWRVQNVELSKTFLLNVAYLSLFWHLLLAQQHKRGSI